jgi:hypothetical protein
MKNVLSVLLLFGTTLLAAQSAPVKHIHRIYVAELHFRNNPDSGGFVRSKLISSLVQECGSGCTVVEDIGANGDNGGDTADGVLTGTVLVETSDNQHYRIQGAMRLVDKDGTVVWAATIYSSPFARSASSSFADNTAKKLSSFLSQSKTQ